MVSVARFAVNVIIGISVANSIKMDSPRSLALVFAARNLLYSSCCEFSTLIMAEPSILSLITLFSQSIISRLFLNKTLTFLSTIKKVPPIIGMIAITGKANFQLIINNKTHEPIIINTDEVMDTTACETNNFIESMSEVKFVRSREGLVFWIYA